MDISIPELRRVWTDQVIGKFIVSRLEWFREQTGTAHEFLVLEVKCGGITADMAADPVWVRLDGEANRSCYRRDGSTESRTKISFQKKLVPLGLEPQASLVFGQRISLGYLLDVAKLIYEGTNWFTVEAAHSWLCASVLVELLSSEGKAIWEPEDADCRYYWDCESRHYDPDQVVTKRIKRSIKPFSNTKVRKY
ncbi:hypothetical protein FRC12_002964, partial [Ceratobasidium sp. 428]